MNKWLLKGLLSLFLLSLCIVGFYSSAKHYLNRPLSLDKPINYIVQPGWGIATISQDLADKNILKYAWVWLLYGRLFEDIHLIKQGEYLITQAITPKELLQQMIKGKVIQYRITFIEGWNIHQLIAHLAQDKLLIKKLDKTITPVQLQKILNLSYYPEGYFFPDTYFYNKGATDIDILKRAHKKMITFLEKAWQERDRNLQAGVS